MAVSMIMEIEKRLNPLSAEERDRKRIERLKKRVEG
jgi:hypothetical protein